MFNLHEELRFAIDPPHRMPCLNHHQNRHSAISMYGTHAYDVCALRLSAQVPPEAPSTSPPLGPLAGGQSRQACSGKLSLDAL